MEALMDGTSQCSMVTSEQQQVISTWTFYQCVDSYDFIKI